MTQIIKNVFFQDEILSLYKGMSCYIKDGTIIPETGRYIITCDYFHTSELGKPIFDKIEKIVFEKTNKKTKAYGFGFHLYKQCFGQPNLPPHIDEYPGEIVFDYQMDSTLDWPIKINKKEYSLNNNDAILFEGENVAHSRPQKFFGEKDYVLMFIINLVSEKHWSNFTNINPRSQEKLQNTINTIREDKENW